MKKQISTILCLSLLAAAMASCGGEGTEQPVTQAQTTEPVATEEPIPLPEADYAGTDIKILTAAEQWQYLYVAEQTGEAIDDAVFNRNRAVEERYNVKLDYQVYNGYNAGKEAVRSALTGSVMGGSAEFDLMVGGVSYISSYAAENLYTDLYGFDVLQLDQPWWFADVNAELDLVGHLYLGSGYFGMLSVENAVVTYFNKQVAEDHGMEDFYSLVLDGKWTYDKMIELSKKVTADLDGDGKYNANDRVGIVSTDDYMRELLYAFGHTYTTRDENGIVTLKDPTEKLVSISEMLSEIVKSNDMINCYDTAETLTQHSTADEACQVMQNLFAANKALFMVHRLAYATYETLRNMEKYGLLPLPKYDEAQQSYITPIVNDVAAIPGVVKDAEMSATLLEALQYYTYETVYPQYYEIALKRKGTRDNDSEKMLDLIFEHTIIDFAYIYHPIVGTELCTSISQKNYASWAAKNYKKFHTNIEKLMETVRGFES